MAAYSPKQRRPFSNSYLSRRRLVSLAAGAGGSLLVAACGGKARPAGTATGSTAGGGPAQTGGTFTYYWNANPASLDPQFSASGSTTSFACAAMSALFRFKIGSDPSVGLNHDLENELAVSAESPDAATWTFKLRKDANFHNIAPVNGHPVEAEDVKATLTRAVTSPQNPNRGTLGMIDPAAIETPASDTIVLKLKYPYAPLQNLMASVQYGLIFPREALAGSYDPSKQIIGSGPFVFDSYTPDVGVSLKKNPSYFEKGFPYVDQAKHAIIPDSAQELAQFTGGNLDILHLSQTDSGTAIKSNPNAHVVKATGGGNHPLYFQMGDPSSPFQDIRLRRAVSLAIDRDAIGKAIYAGQYQPGFSVNLSMGKWALHSDQLSADTQQYYKFNLDQAKQLVQAAGASNLNLKFAWPLHAFETDFDTVAQTLSNMLSALPWKITLVPLDYNKDFLAGGKGYLYGYFPGHTILYSGANPFGETDQYLYTYWHSQSAANAEHLHDTQLDALIDKARGTVDAEARRLAYLDAQKYIADKMYEVAGLPNGYTYTLTRPEVQNYNWSPETNSDGRSFRTIWLKQ